MASMGYPGKYDTGYLIEGLNEAATVSPGNVMVFHAGTKRDSEGRIVTSGGRVLAVTALGDSMERARKIAYEAVGKISFTGAYYRKDIGLWS